MYLGVSMDPIAVDRNVQLPYDFQVNRHLHDNCVDSLFPGKEGIKFRGTKRCEMARNILFLCACVDIALCKIIVVAKLFDRSNSYAKY